MHDRCEEPDADVVSYKYEYEKQKGNERGEEYIATAWTESEKSMMEIDDGARLVRPQELERNIGP